MKSNETKYNVTIDGEIITSLMLPMVMSEHKRDEIRGMIAVTYNVPRHYFRLKPAVYSSINVNDFSSHYTCEENNRVS